MLEPNCVVPQGLYGLNEMELKSVISLSHEHQLWLYGHTVYFPEVKPGHRDIFIPDNPECADHGDATITHDWDKLTDPAMRDLGNIG